MQQFPQDTFSDYSGANFKCDRVVLDLITPMQTLPLTAGKAADSAHVSNHSWSIDLVPATMTTVMIEYSYNALQGKHGTAVERVRRMSLETAPRELTDTPSLSLRANSYAGHLRNLSLLNHLRAINMSLLTSP